MKPNDQDRDIKDTPIRLITCGQFVKWDDFDVENPRHAEALKEKLRETFPAEFNSKYAKVYIMDCRKYGDPDHDRALRGHSGYNPRTLKDFLFEGAEAKPNYAENAVFDFFDWTHQLLSDPDNAPDRITLVTLCVKGKHRSVSLAAILEHCLQKLFFTDVETSQEM